MPNNIIMYRYQAVKISVIGSFYASWPAKVTALARPEGFLPYIITGVHVL